MSNRPWMPFYVGDYLKGTGHLSGAEHGAYLLLMFHYWDKGSIPTDDKRLARIAKMTDKQWQSSRKTIAEFFSAEWRNARIESEIQKATEISLKRQVAANVRYNGAKVIPFGGAK